MSRENIAKQRHRTPLNNKSPFDRIRSVWVKSFVGIIFAGIVLLVGEITGAAAIRIAGFCILGFFSFAFITAYLLGMLQFPRFPGNTSQNKASTPREPPLAGSTKTDI